MQQSGEALLIIFVEKLSAPRKIIAWFGLGGALHGMWFRLRTSVMLTSRFFFCWTRNFRTRVSSCKHMFDHVWTGLQKYFLNAVQVKSWVGENNKGNNNWGKMLNFSTHLAPNLCSSPSSGRLLQRPLASACLQTLRKRQPIHFFLSEYFLHWRFSNNVFRTLHHAPVLFSLPFSFCGRWTRGH